MHGFPSRPTSALRHTLDIPSDHSFPALMLVKEEGVSTEPSVPGRSLLHRRQPSQDLLPRALCATRNCVYSPLGSLQPPTRYAPVCLTFVTSPGRLVLTIPTCWTVASAPCGQLSRLSTADDCFYRYVYTSKILDAFRMDHMYSSSV